MEPTRPETPNATLVRNLEALRRADPGLAARLLLPAGSDHVLRGPDGALLYRPHGTAHPLAVEPEAARELVAAARAGGGTPIVLGVGAGELLDAALEAGPSGPHPFGVEGLIAWERDPWLLRLALSERDFAEPLASGRLRLLLGTDLARTAPGAGVPVVHPVLGSFYRREVAFARRDPDAPVAALCAGGVVVDDVGRALAAAGYAVYTLDVERLALEELDRSLRDLGPALVLSVNYRHGLAEFCRDRGAKLVVWEVDPATSFLPPLDGPCPDAHVFTYRRSHVEAYREAGFASVAHLPLSADPDFRVAPADAVRGRVPVSFVGSSMVDNAAPFAARFVALAGRLARLGPGDAADALRGLLALQRAEPFRFLLEEALDARLPGLRAAARAEGGEDPLVLAGEIAASERRLVLARALGPAGLEVWGDAGWRRAEGTGTRYRGPCGHGPELNRVYAESAVNLDVGRVFQRDIVTLRVFDVLAVGGFALVERSDALGELFELGVELESYGSLEEFRAKLARARDEPEWAREIAARGRRAVRERHTTAARLATMLGRAEATSKVPAPCGAVANGTSPSDGRFGILLE